MPSCFEPRCSKRSCSESVVCDFHAIFLSMLGSLIPLVMPFVYSIKIKSGLLIAVYNYQVSGTTIGLFIVFLLSWFVSSNMKHSNHLECAITSAGIPGIFIGISNLVLI